MGLPEHRWWTCTQKQHNQRSRKTPSAWFSLSPLLFPLLLRTFIASCTTDIARTTLTCPLLLSPGLYMVRSQKAWSPEIAFWPGLEDRSWGSISPNNSQRQREGLLPTRPCWCFNGSIIPYCHMHHFKAWNALFCIQPGKIIQLISPRQYTSVAMFLMLTKLQKFTNSPIFCLPPQIRKA